ncbi:MAG: hypothetical protein KME20_10420 [Kaiparowitsia implicata GSE-PSE-MK54-09C]|nr:hypothetical protein [Kaiparowitsia implicata GSE-PSE-MK54-09C]
MTRPTLGTVTAAGMETPATAVGTRIPAGPEVPVAARTARMTMLATVVTAAAGNGSNGNGNGNGKS